MRVPKCPDLTPEQIRSTPPAAAEAWLIDQWGAAHGIASGALIGRDLASADMAVLHHTVSARHAYLERRGDSWVVLDLDSSNGTFVNERRSKSTRVYEGSILQVGDVAFGFTTRLLDSPNAPRGAGRTGRSRAGQFIAGVTLRRGESELVVKRTAEGGIVTRGTVSVVLARLEYAVLRSLIEATRNASGAETAYVSSTDLAEHLAFKLTAADSDNVRDLVRRLRRKLHEVDAEDLVDSERGLGYRLAWTVAPPK